MKSFYAILLTSLLMGCATTRYTNTVVRDTTVSVLPPVIEYNGIPDVNNQGVFVDNADTVLIVKHDTLRKTFYVKVKPDTVRVTFRDTSVVTKYEEKIIQTPFMSKVGMWAGGAIIMLVLILVGKSYLGKLF